MREVTTQGKTIEEAVQTALESLKTTKENVIIDVLEEPKRGLLGVIGVKPALVKVTLRYQPIDKTIEYIENMMSKMGISCDIKVISQDERNVECQLMSQDAALIIGKRGQTLNAIQLLANLMINKHSDHKVKLTLDVENYRLKRKESLERLANRTAERVKTFNRPVKLDPMPSYERKIIHTALQNIDHVTTRSEGEEPQRYVIVFPKS
ncbi:spoIIIJ-associated protein [Scopulibacillus daqui]|uniref:RNA-binding protein KhpB n=1 Tax=Scopulibacillus daqui TaxID=1469162 RepID=A0ABS2Q1F5_9BACL|nr:spoIIIJ-associated protein [Scopulibacillus daqui]